MCLKDDISYKTNNCNKPMGRFSSAFLHSKFPSPSGAHFPSPTLPLRSRRQQKQGRDVCDVSPLLLVLLRVMRHWTIVYMHVLHWCTTHSNCGQKILPFISKYIWMAGFDRHSFLSVFLLHFTFLILEFLKKSVIQELRTRKNGLIKRFSRVGPIITHSRESSNSQRDPQDHAYP